MPEYAEFALQFFPSLESLISPIHAQELVILRNDLLVVVVIENKVLSVVE